jgi:glycosyltransferase involved in cell wall biosynthesis
MKIGIDISQIVYQTGVSRYTEQLVQHLLRLDKKNHYYLYGGSWRKKTFLTSFISQFKRPGVKGVVTSLSPTLADFFWNRWRLFGPEKNLGQLDVFHASNWAIPPVKAQLVTTIHDLTFLKFPQSHTAYSVAVHTRHLQRAKQYAAAIITDSYSTQKDLIDQGVPAEKISVVHLAPAKIFRPIREQSKITAIEQKYQLQKPFILSVGTQEPRKNLTRLIKAFSALNPRRLDLVIVGKFGWGERSRPVAGVKLLGFVPDEDLAVLYSAAKVFVYPSLYEGFGLPVLEAMACGCPVITSNVSSLPELGGSAVIYVNPRKIAKITQGIKQVLALSSGQRQQLKHLGFSQAKKFSWRKTAQKTIKVYQKTLKAKS